jgi:hypothetical protein
MARTWNCQCGGGRQWLLLGLLLILAFLGHDLLMAAEAMTAPIATTTAHESHAAPAHDPETASLQHGDRSGLPVTCQIGQRAAPRSGDDPAPVDRDVASALGVVGIPAAPSASAVVAWDEPRWPPGALRAWLQVYRI